MSIQDLIQQKYAPDAFIYGEYFIIKYLPDSVAGQVFNLGVGFIEDGSDKIRLRMIERSLRGFACIYGKQAVEGLRLLIDTVVYSLGEVGHASSPSPQVFYTEKKPIKGLSLQSIMNSLYRDYIHMDHYESKKKTKLPIVNTEQLRKELKDNLKSVNKDYLYHDKAIQLKSDIDSTNIGLHLPIWYRDDTDSLLPKRPSLFGSIVSADYVDAQTLSFNLDYLGSTSISNACRIVGRSSRAGLFVYRPKPNDRIDKEAMDMIDNCIDNAFYTLKRMQKLEGYDISIEVESDKDVLQEKAMEFIDETLAT